VIQILVRQEVGLLPFQCHPAQTPPVVAEEVGRHSEIEERPVEIHARDPRVRVPGILVADVPVVLLEVVGSPRVRRQDDRDSMLSAASRANDEWGVFAGRSSGAEPSIVEAARPVADRDQGRPAPCPQLRRRRDGAALHRPLSKARTAIPGHGQARR